MPFQAFFDRPENYSNKFDFHELGGSPQLLKNFIATIEQHKNDIEEINLCWYLFNNKHLHNYLKNLSLQDIKVNVVTIPLEGYDHRNPKQLTLDNSQQKTAQSYTKYDLAKEIFKEAYRSNDFPNYKIYFFPHLYVRSPRVKKFSRGNLPYSLHLKAAYIRKKSGKGYLLCLSSSNLAVRDLVKYESMLVIEDELQHKQNTQTFFKHLIDNSIYIKNYHSGFNTNQNAYDFLPSFNDQYSFFTAPFYFDSANKLEETLVQILQKAQKRIVVCSQHLAAFDYSFNATYHSQKNFNERRQGILGTVIQKAKEGIAVQCFSQTFAPPNDQQIQNQFQNKRFRRPANTRNFQAFYLALTNGNMGGNVQYFVNENLHSKFIIVDDLLIFCTYNFTPTQFTFLDKVKIDRFTEMQNLSYEGIHCEVGGHIVVKDKEVVAQFLENIEGIVAAKGTVRVI